MKGGSSMTEKLPTVQIELSLFETALLIALLEEKSDSVEEDLELLASHERSLHNAYLKQVRRLHDFIYTAYKLA